MSFSPILDVLSVLTREELLETSLHILPGVFRVLEKRFLILISFVLTKEFQKSFPLSIQPAQLNELGNDPVQIFNLQALVKNVKALCIGDEFAIAALVALNEVD